MYKVYEIKAGDTIDALANFFDTSADELMALNNISEGFELMPGRLIVVPNKGQEIFTKYIVQKGDTMYNIAQKNSLNLNDLLMLNGLDNTDYIYPGQEILLPNKDVTFYITRQGDTIGGITKYLNGNINEIAMQNSKLYLLPDQLIIYKKEKN